MIQQQPTAAVYYWYVETIFAQGRCYCGWARRETKNINYINNNNTVIILIFAQNVSITSTILLIGENLANWAKIKGLSTLNFPIQ